MDVLMPQLGETVAEGKISRWFVAAGDAVKPGDNLFEIETDKVSMEVPAIAAGTLAEIRVGAGEVAPVGAVVAIIAGAGEKAPISPPLIPAKAGIQKSKELGPRRSLPSGGAQARPVGGDERTEAPRATTQMEPFREVRSPEHNYGPARLAGGAVTTPLARRLAGEAGIDLAHVKGSGPHGRIVARDVQSAFKAPASAPAPAEEVMPNLMLTADVAVANALALCAEANGTLALKLALADIVAKAWATALQRAMPEWPTDIEVAAGENLIMIRNVATQSLSAIARERERGGDQIGARAASSEVSIAEVRGIRSVAAVPKPHKMKLALGSPRRAPVETADGGVAFADMVTATLSCDGRLVSRALAVALLAAFKGFVEKPVTMIV